MGSRSSATVHLNSVLRLGMVITGIVLCALGLGLPATMLISDAILDFWLLMVALALFILLFGVWLIRSYTQTRQHRIIVYTGGLIFDLPRGRAEVPWDEMTDVELLREPTFDTHDRYMLKFRPARDDFHKVHRALGTLREGPAYLMVLPEGKSTARRLEEAFHEFRPELGCTIRRLSVGEEP